MNLSRRISLKWSVISASKEYDRLWSTKLVADTDGYSSFDEQHCPRPKQSKTRGTRGTDLRRTVVKGICHRPQHAGRRRAQAIRTTIPQFQERLCRPKSGNCGEVRCSCWLVEKSSVPEMAGFPKLSRELLGGLEELQKVLAQFSQANEEASPVSKGKLNELAKDVLRFIRQDYTGIRSVSPPRWIQRSSWRPSICLRRKRDRRIVAVDILPSGTIPRRFIANRFCLFLTNIEISGLSCAL